MDRSITLKRCHRSPIAIYLTLLAAMTSTYCAEAAVIYEYTGNNYTNILNETPPTGTFTSGMSISGSFALDNALPVNTSLTSVVSLPGFDYSFFDGITTYTSSNSNPFNFQIETDGLGQIVNWTINLRIGSTLDLLNVGDQAISTSTIANNQDTSVVFECVTPFSGGCSLNNDVGSNSNLSGSWTGPPAPTVPLPAAVWLFGSGLLGLIGIARRKKTA